MATHHLKGRFERPHRWRRRGMLALLLLVATLAGVYLYITRPARLAKLAGGTINQISGATVEIGTARFGFDGKIHLQDVVLRVPDAPSDENKLVHIQEILIQHDLLQLFKGAFEPRSMTLQKPTFYSTEYIPDDATKAGVFNYQFLRNDSQKTEPAVPETLPEIFVRQGQMVFGRVEGGEYQARYTIDLDGTLTEKNLADDHYLFALRELGKSEKDAANLNGELNLKTMGVKLTGGNVQIETDQINLLPRHLQHWWKLLDPKGTFTEVAFDYTDKQAEASWRVEDVELSLPYVGEVDRQGNPVPDGKQFRLTGVTGTFEATTDRVEIKALRGKVEDIEYEIEGVIGGMKADSPFHMTLKTKPFHVDKNPHLLLSLPVGVRWQYDNFKPAGTFATTVRVRRHRAGGRIDYEGVMDLTDSTIEYHKFPIPLKDVNGRIAFDDLSMTVNLKATGPKGGEIDIAGKVAPPGNDASYHFEITAEEIPVDESFLEYVPDNYRETIRMFADRPQLEKLNKLGLLNTDAQNRFDLGGVTSLEITADRPEGPDKPLALNIDIDMKGLNAMFRHWPYPVTLTGGTIKVRPNHVLVEELRGKSMPRGEPSRRGNLLVNGRVDIPLNAETGDRVAIPDLHLRATGAPIDELLLATIPSPQDQWIRRFALEGLLSAEARVFYNDQEEIDYEVTGDLHHGSAQPFEGAFRIDALTGTTVIRPGRINVKEFEGKWIDPKTGEESTIAFSGEATRPTDDWQFVLDIAAQNMQFSAPLLDLIPPDEADKAKKIAVLLKTHKPTGRFNGELHYESGLPGGEPIYTLAIEPSELAFDIEGQRIELTGMTGKTIIDQQKIRFDGLHGKFDEGQFTVTGDVNTGAGGALDLQFELNTTGIDETSRLIIPQSILKTIDDLRYEGAYAIRNGRLFYDPPDDESKASASDFRFTGDLALEDAKLDIGVDVTEINAAIRLDIAQAPGESKPNVKMDVLAESLRASDRLIGPLSLSLNSLDDRRYFALKDVKGSVYGGVLLGKGTIDTSEPAKFSIELSVLDSALEPTLEPEKEANNDGDNPRTRAETLESGRFSANLTLEGAAGEIRSRRGRGSLQISQAELYKLPVALGVLQLLNLRAPQAKAFDRADANFVVDGDDVLFERVSISAPTVEIYGAGRLKFSSREIDLVLYSNNPGGWNLGPLSDIGDEFRNQIVSIVVSGTIDEPKSKAESFRGISKTFERIFGKKRKLVNTPNP